MVFDIMVLWLFLSTCVSMWSPVATSSDSLPASCTSGTFSGSILEELGFAPTSAGWTSEHCFSLHWYSSATANMAGYCLLTKLFFFPKYQRVDFCFYDIKSISGFSTDSVFQYSIVKGQQFYKTNDTLPVLVSGGWEIFCNVYKVINIEFVRGSCNGMVSIRLLPAGWDIFLSNARAQLTDSRSRRPISSPWYLMVGKSSFLRSQRIFPRSQINRLSLEWIMGAS